MLKKQFKQVYSVFSIFLMLFQTVAPAAFFVTPAYAATEAEVVVSDVTLDFSEDTNEFVIAGSASAATEYVLSYDDNNDETPEEAIIGEVEPTDGAFEEIVYAGTCSGEDCVADDVVSGTLAFGAAGFSAEYEIVDGVLWMQSGATATVAEVELGRTYVAPQNSYVTVTFTSLPENPGTLSIEEITLTDEQVKKLGAVSNIAYDITSSMEDGTFEYELTLPRPTETQDELKVKHAESVDTLDDAQEVETVEVTDKVTAKGLDHFTVFVIVREVDIAHNIADVFSDTSSWFFYNDETDTIDSSLGSMVFGQATPPYGLGSAKISVSGTQRRNLATYQFSGTKLSDITELGFSTYNPSSGNGGSSNRSAYLNFNVTFDGNDTWQRRLSFVPNANGTVIQDSWQAWDAIDGGNALWSWSGFEDNGNKWPDGNTDRYRTWSDLLSTFPNIAVRTTDSWLGLRVGEPYSDGYTEYIDGFVFGTSSGTTVFNFEPDLYQPPSTNDDNRDNGWAHVNQVDISPGETTLDFVSTRNFYSCFEYRTDGDVSQAAGNPNYNTMVEDLYPYYCVKNETQQHVFEANEYVEVRMVFGAEGDERFDWTRFDVGEKPPATPTGLTIFDHNGVELGCSGYTNDRSIRIDWDDNSEADLAYYQFDIKDKDDHAQPSNSEYNATIRNTDGDYKYRVRAVDTAGNKSEPTEWCEVTLDRTAPGAPTIEFPNEGDAFNTTPILNDWSDVSDSSGIMNYRVQYEYDDGHTFSGYPYRETTASQRNHTPNSSEEGGVKFRVQAFDNAGNEGAWSEWRHYYYDMTYPEMSEVKMFVNGTESWVTKPGDTVKIQATVTDGSEIDKVQVWVREFPWSPNHNELTSGNLTNVGGDTWEFEYVVPTTYKDGDALNQTDGGNYFNFRPYDVAGNSHIGWRHNFTIDATKPVVAVTAPTADSSSNIPVHILGTATDNFSGIGSVALHMYRVNGSSKTLVPGCTSLPGTISGDNWEVEIDNTGSCNLTDGKYEIAAWAYDGVGNPGWAPRVQFFVDTTAPSTTLSSPSNGDATNTAITIAGESTDSSVVDHVNLYYSEAGQNNWVMITQLDNTAGDEPFVFSHDWTPSAEGVYDIKAAGVDSVGNEENSAYALGVVYDLTSPAVPTNLLRQGSDFQIYQCGDRAQRINMVPFWDENAESDFSHYEYSSFHANGSQGLDEKELDTARLENTWIAPADGTYGYAVRAVDNAGNKSAWALTDETHAGSCQITYDSEVGVPTITAPSNGDYFNVNTIRAEWTEVTDPSGMDKYEIMYEYEVGGVPTVAYREVPASRLYRDQSLSGSVQGDFTISVRAYDALGNVGDWSAPVTYTYDTVNPSSVITTFNTAQSGEEVETNSFDGLIEGTATDATSGVAKVDLEIMYTPFGSTDTVYWNGSDWQSIATMVTASGTDTWNYQIDETKVEEGIYDITSHATDNAGNVESTYTIKIVYDKTIPEVVLTIDPASPDGDNGWYRFTEPTITLEASDNYNVDYIEFQWNTTTDGNWTTYSGPINPPSEGQNILYYRAVDVVGNVSDFGVKDVKYDSTNPAGEPLNVRVENITADDADGLWEAPEDDSDVFQYKLSWKHEDGEEYGATVSRDTFEHVLDNLKDGLWTFTVRAVDAAGNFTEKKKDFRVGPGPSDGSDDGDVLGTTTTNEEIVGTGTGGLFVTQASAQTGADEEGETQEESAQSEQNGSDDEGSVLGESTCAPWLYYLPLLLLLVQLMAIIGFELFRREPSMLKIVVAVVATLAVIGAFQALKDTSCYVEGSWLQMIATWFPGVALVTGVVSKLLAYGFIEEA